MWGGVFVWVFWERGWEGDEMEGEREGGGGKKEGGEEEGGGEGLRLK